MNVNIFMLNDHEMQRTYIFITTFGLSTTKLTLVGTHSQQAPRKHGDSPSSHSTGVEILVRRPPSLTCTTATSVVHCTGTCFILLTNFYVIGLTLSSKGFC